MQVKYMQDQRSRVLGVISGVTEWEFMLKLLKINVKEWYVFEI
jgi:hypothetical protein